MQIGMVGLGRMGGNMARRLLGDGHAVVAYDPNPSTVSEIVGQFWTHDFTRVWSIGQNVGIAAASSMINCSAWR